MNPLTLVMGLADLVCMGLIFFSFGANPFTVILALIMIPKGVMSLIS